MIRPLLPLLFGFIGGILLEHFWHVSVSPALPHPFWALLSAYGGLLFLWGWCYRTHRARAGTWVLILLATLLGISRYALYTYLPAHHISRLIDTEVPTTVEGFLVQPPERFGKKRYLTLQTTWVETGGYRYRATGKIRITLTSASCPDSGSKRFTYGDTIRARLRLRIPRNSETFDYQEYLRRQGIYFLGTLRHDRYLCQLQPHQGIWLLRGIFQLQQRLLHVFEKAPSPSSSDSPESAAWYRVPTKQAIQVIKAMTLGKSRGIGAEVREKFRNAGMYHFLVVSGLHIGILTWFLHYVLTFFSVPFQYRSWLLSAVLFVYAGVTGFHFPVLRAVMMASVFYFSITYNRLSDAVYSLSFASGLIIFLFPLSLFDVSFQLTVAATASILMSFRFLRRCAWFNRARQLPPLARSPLMILLTTTGAMLGVSPLMLYYFGQFYPYSFISNLLAVPIVSLLVPSALLVNFLSLLIHTQALLAPLTSASLFLAKSLIALASFFPTVDMSVSPPPPWSLIVYYGGLFGLLKGYRGHG